MGFLDILLGRSKPAGPDLDQLFALPSAAVTLQAATRFRPTGTGSVAFKAAEGAAFSGLTEHVEALLALDEGRFAISRDTFGYTWLTRTGDAADLEGLVTDLHAVNTSLVEAGYGTTLLCTLVVFGDGPQRLGLIYLYKRGTWYPFAPTAQERRDTALELQVRAVIADDLRIEPDLGRWFPVHGAPGL
ncbi:hypothetical protein N864_23530 [Intrasporangium chromatireducens Q5-1]|uniref:Uncharacterized protein n=1 Tax=Intrasporangium chromatireducens Q5-1 TaxID=584657 RepID=W9GN91_9MICO|nr:hypothetical protein [Intrasporangium chromatireducens]EWT07741.1 hypothetical protein N864_23530 [Intrasporangium chromatireducens Q5-1]